MGQKPPIIFHRVRGENIRFSPDNKTADRFESFCKGLVFSDRPLAVQEQVHIKIAKTVTSWSGAVRFGLTQQSPEMLENNLPKYACPDLTMKPGNWAKAVDEPLASENTVFTFYYDRQGVIYMKRDGGPADVFLTGINVSQPLYAVFDLYGNTRSISLVDSPGGPAGEAGPSRPAATESETSAATTPTAPSAPPAATPANQAVVAGISQGISNLGLNNRKVPSVSFGNVTQWGESCFVVQNSQHVDITKTVASSKTGRPGGVARLEKPLTRGQSLVFNVGIMFRPAPIRFLITPTSPLDLTEWSGDFDKLVDELGYCIADETQMINQGLSEEIAIHLHDKGLVYLNHGGRGWKMGYHFDEKLAYYIVFDLQNVKKMTLIGITNQLAPSASEVSSPTLPDTSSSQAQMSKKTMNDLMAMECVVCQDRPKNTLLYPCKHVHMCYECTQEIRKHKNECPTCRMKISNFEKVFL